MEKSLYIHIPFCRRKCLYCSFYSDLYNEGEAALYIEAICGQIGRLDGLFSTVYVGGGTPTVLSRALLERLLNTIKKRLEGDCEFTLEANPESLDDEKIRLALDSGVNRISIGLQSLRDEKLRRLGRIHNSRMARDAVLRCAKSGFKNISIDLIFGIWDERIDMLREDIRAAVLLPITHASCYELTYEKGTPLFSALKNKSVLPLDDGVIASMYEETIELASQGGLKQYEVSNFSKEGYRSRHNMNYWDNSSYRGLGPSAFSYIDGLRSRNICDIKEYMRRLKEGKALCDFTEKLSPIKRAKETAAVKIRTKDGIDFERFKDKTGFDFYELERKAVEGLLRLGLVKYKRDGRGPCGIALKRKGFLFCDTVSSALL